MLYFHLSFIYIHIEFVACRSLADVVTGYGPGSSFQAEHVHLFQVLGDEIRKKEEPLHLGRRVNAGSTVSLLPFQFNI